MKNCYLKLILLVLAFWQSFSEVNAQNFPIGNEWINYDQSYLKIPITQEGIYRISYNTLNSALQQINININNIRPSWMQLFNNGLQVPIFIPGESNQLFFETDDYIEFYADINRGQIDTQLFWNGNIYVNPNYSLFNDTAYYFLTWNSNAATPKLRYQQETDINFGSYPLQNYIFKTVRQDYLSYYLAGETNINGVTDFEYITGEGYCDAPFGTGASVTKTLAIPQLSTAYPNSTVKFCLLGANRTAHNTRIQFGNVTFDTIYFGYAAIHKTYTIPTQTLGSNTANITFTSLINTGTDRNSISYTEITYPHSLDLEGSNYFKMQVPDASGTKMQCNFTNFNNAATDTAFLLDLTNNKRMRVIHNSGNWQTIIPNSGTLKTCIIAAENVIKNINTIQFLSSPYSRFINYNDNSYNSSDYFIITANKFVNEANSYKNYRNSKGFNTVVLDIDELYDQFGYGIKKHPISIRNFCKYALNRFSNEIKGIFIIGKAYPASSYRSNTTLYANTIVPSFGYPPSDNLFSAGITDNTITPAIPIGRLAARTSEHVNSYAQKIQEYEQQQLNAQEWMKLILHFGGGTSANEQATLASYLRAYEYLIEDTIFGGNVKTFLKTSTAPIQINQSDSLKSLINNGVSMMTFFGHAAGSGFDQSIDNIDEYQNYQKYPFLLANSCFAGDLFEQNPTTTETFVLIPNKGMIGFLASGIKASSSQLNLYSYNFYRNISSSQGYNKSVGFNIKKTIETIMNQPLYTNDKEIRRTCLAMSLHGDPAIKINSHEKPDLQALPANQFTTPTEITNEIDTFQLHIVIKNIGKALYQPIVTEIKRIFPDNTEEKISLDHIAPFYCDTLTIKYPVDHIKGQGINKFLIYTDVLNNLSEISEINNNCEIQVFIKSADIVPVYPYQYAIVDKTPTLKATTSNPFSSPAIYEFQLDTTSTFSSPIKIIYKTAASNGVIQWQPSFNFIPEKVYYWRVSLDSASNGNYNWKNSSFQYVPGKKGWAQAHYQQFENNNYEFISFNNNNKRFEFADNILTITAQTGYNTLYQNEWYKINNVLQSERNCVAGLPGILGGLKIGVIDKISGKAWASLPPVGFTPYGNYHCQPYNTFAFDFRTDQLEDRQNIKNFLNSIPAGNGVVICSFRSTYAESYDSAMLQEFAKLGCTRINTLGHEQSYLMFGRKQNTPHPGDATEIIGFEPTGLITLSDTMKISWNQGIVETPLIGPAQQWQSINWKQHSVESNNTDSVLLAVIAIQNTGLSDTFYYTSDSLLFNIGFINAQTYPYLKLRMQLMDNTNRTPAQLEYWQVFYEGVPETSIDAAQQYYLNKTSLQEGENFIFSTATHNLSDYNMDSLLIKYWILDNNRNLHNLSHPRKRAHPAGDILLDTIIINTRNLTGNNNLWMEVNPNNDQLEQYHFNNIGEVKFNVLADKTNPLLDVTFDGIRILNGDIVSAKPFIQITLLDENNFIAMEDTSLIKVFITRPGQEIAERIYFSLNGKAQMHFYPAQMPKNKCTIEYPATFPEDGRYTLSVQAKDPSNNSSGDIDYAISFEIINKSTITEVMNWPNPFSTKTHFVFTLTGSEIPTYFKIQIMTITGKLVREIRQEELGSLHIGRNITEYAWDGRDEYGDLLANGVYLYRVITNINGEKIEKNATAASKYFIKEFGKMYIMR